MDILADQTRTTRTGTTGAPGERGEILLVDDSSSALSMLSTLLTEAGYRVREAPSGELALMTLRVRLPDLVLLDVRMPNMDGFEVCRCIKADRHTHSVTVIFLSAQDDTADKVRGLQVGAVDFITKTFPHDEVFARLDTHIALSRVKKALELERANLEDRVRERTEQLGLERVLLRNVIDSGPDWIFVTDRDHRYVMVNQNMAKAMGYAKGDDLVGKLSCKDFPRATCPKTAASDICDWHDDEQKVLSGQTVFHPRERVVLPGGRAVLFETHKTPLRDGSGAAYGVLCYRRDITQRLRMEDETKALEQALWQAKKMEAVGQLAGGIAHDFNHLLSLILGYAQFAQTALANGKTEKLNNYLTEVLKAGAEGQAVVGQLLAFSRTDEQAKEAIDVGAIVCEVVENLRPITGNDIELNLSVAVGLPPLFIKSIQVKQILTNLLLNARDALELLGSPGSSGSCRKIDVRLQREYFPAPQTCASCRKRFAADYIILSVADNGPGMLPDIIDKIFDPFFTTKEVGKGAGLGLPMVHGITHSVGGHISVVSSPGAGSRLFICIPEECGLC